MKTMSARARGLLAASGLCITMMANPIQAQNLSVEDVDRIVGQAIAEAASRGVGNGAVAVTDRVGNVLGLYVLNPAQPPMMTVSSQRGIPVGNGLEQVQLPAMFGAVAKAITGAYLSSSGNAFSTRTASLIVQENFYPGEIGQPGGPLSGVQFSQLPCSDLSRFGEGLGTGPRRSPLGLSADPGGFPLYKNGVVVGGVGVLFDGLYGLDGFITDYDRDVDELVAIAATRGFEAPENIKGHRITVEGKVFRYADADLNNVNTSTPAAPNGANYVALPGYTPAGRRAGQGFGTVASGVRPDSRVEFPAVDAWVLDDGQGANRFSPRAAVVGGLSANEVRAVAQEALSVATRARAQIRRPLGSFAQVSVSVVDLESNILTVARTPDAPVFGIDVSLQKARSALFFSRPTSAVELRAVGGVVLIPNVLAVAPLGAYVDAMAQFVGPGALSNGVAYGERSVGNLARPFYPDGLNGMGAGPLAKPFNVWSPFNTGLQLDLVIADIVARLDGSVPPPQGCTALPRATPSAAGAEPGPARLANGLQIFAGGVPIYRGDQLVGAIGVSGDGIDQDDMIAFLGVHNAGQQLRTGLGNAPAARRADTVEAGGINLRYVNCPFTPFLNSREQRVCVGK
jgi:uncharacterized protein GlcG (DUF336 family)